MDYIYRTKIRLHDTDAAGRLFFSNQFKIFHDAYESMLSDIGFGFSGILLDQKFFLPIVHAEADYKAPLFVDDPIETRVRVADIGRTSFTLAYEMFQSARGTVVGTGKTVHVTVDKDTGRKINLPTLFLEKITALRDG
jgi:1,4-dihydroxy-2-naphthoyl-CoA hydrolase